MANIPLGRTGRWNEQAPVAPRSFYGEVGRRLLGDRTALVALAILALMIGSAVAAPLISPHDPLKGDVSERLQSIGSPGHILGTDEQGRDILARLLVGGRISLLTGILPVVIATIIGSVIGAVAGYAGKTVAAVLMRIMDMLYAFPAILLAIAITAALGSGPANTIIAIAIVLIPPIARVAESATKQIIVQEYVEAARLSGANIGQMLLHQLLPNIFSPIFVYASGMIGISIIIASGLSFLGLGAPPPTPEWGFMLNSMRGSIYIQPWVVLLPGLCIFLTSVGFNMLSDSLSDALDIKGAAI